VTRVALSAGMDWRTSHPTPASPQSGGVTRRLPRTPVVRRSTTGLPALGRQNSIPTNPAQPLRRPGRPPSRDGFLSGTTPLSGGRGSTPGCAGERRQRHTRHPSRGVPSSAEPDQCSPQAVHPYRETLLPTVTPTRTDSAQLPRVSGGPTSTPRADSLCAVSTLLTTVRRASLDLGVATRLVRRWQMSRERTVERCVALSVKLVDYK
jgi:hypothetical protein